MNFRTTGILFGLVLAFALVLLGMSLFESDSKSTDLLLEKLVLAGVKESDIDTIEIEREGSGKMKLVRSGSDWKVVEPIQVKADKSAVDNVLAALFKARPIQFDGLSSSKSTHELDPPGFKITVRKGDLSETINVGQILGSSRSAVAFVTTSSRPERPMAVPREGIDPLLKDSRTSGIAKDLAKWDSDYRAKSVFSIQAQAASDNVASLSMVGRGDNLLLTRTPEGWRLTAQFKSRTVVNGKEETTPRTLDNVDADPRGDFSAGPNSFNGVQPLLMALANLQAIAADDFLPDDPAKMAEYGLAEGNPDRIVVELKVKGAPGQPEVTEKAIIGKKVDKEPNKVYVKVPGMPGVIRASTSNSDGIFGVLADPGPLRNRNLFPSDLKTQFVAIDIVKGGYATRLRQAGGSFGSWKLFGEADDPTDANGAAISKILELINQPRVVKDFPAPSPANDANFAGPEQKVELKLWSEIEPPADPKQASEPKYEPKPKGTPVVLQFGKVTRDGTGKVTEVWVRRTLPSGVKTDFILPGEVKTAAGPPPMPGQPFPPATGTDVDVLATVDKSRLDLLSTELKGFSPSPGVVTKLTIAPLNQHALEVSYDDKPEPPYYPTGKWSYDRYPYGQPAAKSPALSADPSEVYSLLSTLSTLSAAAFDLERPSEAQRNERGVGANPLMKVTVTLKAQAAPPALPGMAPPPAPVAEERIYYIGKDVARHGKTFVYAMQEGRNVVFLIDKSVFSRLAAADVRDRTVVRFDVAKVRRVTVFGWAERNPTGPVPVLAFDKNQQGNWAYAPFPPGQAITGIPVNSPALTLDPGKVNDFLHALNGMRAESFLPPGQLPAYGFAPNQRGLGVVVEVEGAAQPIRLVIAAGVKMDADGKTIREYVPVEQADRYVVWMDSASDPTVNPFTISAGALKPFKENYTTFGVR